MPDSPNRNLQATRRYHQDTSHSYWSVRQSGRELDWPNYPRPFKIYPQLDPIPLPRDFPSTSGPALAVPGPEVRGRVTPSEAKGPVPTPATGVSSPTLAQLAALLYYSAGVTRRRSWPGGEIYFRAAACTGALYEIELYLVAADLDALPAGVYHFSPADFSLRRLRGGDWRGVLAEATASQPDVVQAPVAIVATGIYWRNAWKYGARTYRHFGWDNGTIHANLLAMAAAHRVPACLVLGFADGPVGRLLALDMEKEVPLSIVALGAGAAQPALAPAEIPPLHLETVPASSAEVEYPEMRAMHASTILADSAEVLAWRAAASQQPPAQPALAAPPESVNPLAEAGPEVTSNEPRATGQNAGATLESVILRRGSSRRFSHQPITLGQLSVALDFATRPLAADFLAPGERLNDLYVIANAVEGLAEGSYVFARDPLRLERLKAGAFRDQARYLALEQALAGDAAAAVFFLADLEAILARLGNRGYRAMQFEAGILGGRLYLAAYAQRLGATGLTFYDDEVVEFFSPHAAAKAATFLVALGHPAKRLRAL